MAQPVVVGTKKAQDRVCLSVGTKGASIASMDPRTHSESTRSQGVVRQAWVAAVNAALRSFASAGVTGSAHSSSFLVNLEQMAHDTPRSFEGGIKKGVVWWWLGEGGGGTRGGVPYELAQPIGFQVYRAGRRQQTDLAVLGGDGDEPLELRAPGQGLHAGGLGKRGEAGG